MKYSVLISLLVAAGSWGVAAPALAGNVEAETAIEALNAQVYQALEAKDADAFSAFYADDAVWAVTGFGTLHGRQAIRDAYAKGFTDPNYDGAAKELESAVSASDAGDLGYVTARYEYSETLPGATEKRTVQGTEVTIWRKDAAGAWHIVSDLSVDDPDKP